MLCQNINKQSAIYQNLTRLSTPRIQLVNHDPSLSGS